ncbi:MAG TPA: hypothetical protein VH599_08525 [Ktedonobacterales bacterium]|jgi:hypothetical protein
MPKKKYSLSLQEVQVPIREPVIKFGGQPVWLTEPQWPLSSLIGIPMQFIAQIPLYSELFGPLQAQMAYVFMTDLFMKGEVRAGRTVATENPDRGENAVILQPGIWTGPTLPLTAGPTLYKYPDISCEYAVELHPGEDADALASPWPDPFEGDLNEEEEDEDYLGEGDPDRQTAWDLRWEAFHEDKIGGIPVPAPNYDAFPYPGQGKWQLILQFAEDTEGMRYEINFGGNGVGYALLSEDGRNGRFLWMRP